VNVMHTSSPTVRVDGSRAVVGAGDSLELRMNASAVGLLSIRVASAAARVRGGGQINQRDQVALRSVSTDLREEARVLRGEIVPSVTDETAYAVAGVTLTALGQPGDTASATDEDLARRLDRVANDLEKLASGRSLDDALLARLESVFLRAGELVTDSLGESGEVLEGVPQGPGPR